MHFQKIWPHILGKDLGLSVALIQDFGARGDLKLWIGILHVFYWNEMGS